MKILVLNASPKGKNSTTVHTALYLQALHPEHEFTFLPVGQRIKSYEKDFSPVRDALKEAELILFCYPVTPLSPRISCIGSSSLSRPMGWIYPANLPARSRRQNISMM